LNAKSLGRDKLQWTGLATRSIATNPLSCQQLEHLIASFQLLPGPWASWDRRQSRIRSITALWASGSSCPLPLRTIIDCRQPPSGTRRSLLRPFPQQVCPCLPNVVAPWHGCILKLLLLSTLVDCAFVTTACSSLSVISSLPRYALKNFMPVCVGPSGNCCSLTDIR
jgi:hypothetical protein